MVCHRFCRLLKQPVCGDLWGVLQIDLRDIDRFHPLFEMLRWAHRRRTGMLQES